MALKGAIVTAVDISEESLRYAREYAKMLNIEKIEFILGDVHHKISCIEDGQFDLVFMTYGVLCWLNDLQAVFSNAARYLKQRGQFLLIDRYPFLDLLDDSHNKLELRGQYLYDSLPEQCICRTSYIGSGQLSNPTTYQWSHNLGNIFEAPITSRFTIEHFREYVWIHYKRYSSLVK